MHGFNDRQYKLIRYVLESDSECSSKLLSKLLSVSRRTVRSDILSINEKIKLHGARIYANQNGYYVIKKQKEIIINLLSNFVDRIDLPTNLKDRTYYLLGKLCFLKVVDIDELLDEIYVSSSTFYKVISNLKVFLNEFDLSDSLQFEGNYIRLELSEDEIRSLMINIAHDECNVLVNRYPARLMYLLFDNYSKQTLDEVYELLIASNVVEGALISDVSLYILVWTIYIIGIRTALGNKSLSKVKTFTNKATTLFDELEKRTALRFSDNDKDKIMQHVLTLSLLPNNSSLMEVSKATEEIVKEFVNTLQDIYDFNLYEDLELVDNLSMHIEIMLMRLQLGYINKTPMKDEIKSQYQYAFQVATVILPIIEKHTAILCNEDELVFIVIYIQSFLQGVTRKKRAILVTSETYGMSRMVKVWLDRYFDREIHLISIMPVYQITKFIETENIDLILTTTALPNIKNIDVIHINTMPSYDDLLNVQKVIQKNEGVMDNIKFKRLFDTRLVMMFNQKITFEECIEKIALKLFDLGKITNLDNYIRDILMREQYYPTFISDVVLMPHALFEVASESAFGIAILKQPIKHHDKKVSIVILVALEAKYDKSLDVIFARLVQFAKDMKLVKSIVERNEEEDVIGDLKKALL